MKVLAYFKHPPEYTRFCIPEIKALFSIFGIPLCDIFEYPNQELYELSKTKPYLIQEDSFPTFPFVYIKQHDDKILEEIVNRSILLKGFYKIYAEGNSYQEIVQNVDQQEMKELLESKEKFSFIVDPYNRTYRNSREEQIKIIDQFGALPFKGKVDLKDPKYAYYVLENWDNDHKLNFSLKRIYFGLAIHLAPRGVKHINEKYELSRRAYLGPTSCDNDLAFLMANQGRIKGGELLLDPFVGTGGLLIPPSHFGAMCFGTDIDPRVLHGFGVGRYNPKSGFGIKKECSKLIELKENKPDIWLNFRQYGFEFPEIIRMDSSREKFKYGEFFDVIICDPPYGWRATARTSGIPDSKKERKKEKKAAEEEAKLDEKEETLSTNSQKASETAQKEIIQEETELGEESKHEISRENRKRQYVVPTKTTNCDEVVVGLFNLANQVLKKGGYLIFLFPVDKEETNPFSKLPVHERFELLDYSEERVKALKSRILVTMRKKLH